MKTIHMTLMKTLGVALLGSTLLFTSCKKEDTTPVIPGCQVTKSYTYTTGSASPSDSVIYTYSGAKVSKLNMGGDEMTLQYTGDKITRRNFMAVGSLIPDQYDIITHNTDGTISKVESYGRVDQKNYESYARVDFTYTSGKISKLTVSDLTSGTAVKEMEYTYTFTGENITEVTETDYTFTPATATTYTYTFDSNNNYYKKQNSQALLIDPYMGGVDGLFLPIFYSSNNMNTLATEGYSLSVGYTTDEKQNLKSVNVGRLTFMYNYLCQ